MKRESGDKNRKRLMVDMASELRTAVTFSWDLKATTDKQKEKKRESIYGGDPVIYKT